MLSGLIDMLTCMTVSFLLYLFYFFNDYTHWKFKKVPHPTPIGPFGNLLGVLTKNVPIGQYFSKMAQKFDGPYFGFYVFNSPFLIVKDASLARDILVKDTDNFKAHFDITEEMFGLMADLLIQKDFVEVSAKTLKTLKSKFFPERERKLRSACKMMVLCGEKLEKYFERNQRMLVSAKEVAEIYTNNVFETCVLQLPMSSDELYSDGFINLIWRKLTILYYFMIPNLFVLFKLTEHLLQSHAKTLLKQIFHQSMINGKKRDLLDILSHSKTDTVLANEYNPQGGEWIIHLISYLGTSWETISSTISFAFREISIHVYVQDRLKNEIESVIKKYGSLSYDAIIDMNYLDMVVSETLRKYPTTSCIQRVCTKQYVIPKTGLVVEKDTAIIIPQHYLHHRSEHFNNPCLFDPERFSKDNKPKILPHTYLTFENGPIVCIGERFSVLCIKIGIISALRKHTICGGDSRMTLEFERC